jgi:hypothetical protein
MRRKGVSQEQADFAEFYARSRDDCLRTVLAAVRDADKAQDLVAEAFARGLGVMAEGQPSSGPSCVGGPHGAEPQRVILAQAPPGTAADRPPQHG